MRIKVLTVVTLLAVLMCFIPVGRAMASTISPTEGIYGSDITISNLTEGVALYIYWDDTLIKSITSVSSTSTTITVPAAYAGEHTLKVKQSATTNFTFTVLPSITIDSTTGSIGTSITVVGHGFATSEKHINVTYEGSSVKSGITADEEGTWTTTFDVPASVKGKHAIDAYGDTTATTDISNKYFTVSPTVEINPTSGGVGTVVTIKASGFAASESAIKVLYSTKEVRTGILADANGSWSTSFAVPSSNQGSHAITFQGSSTAIGDIADKAFTVAPAISLGQTSGSVDDDLKVSGSGFANNESSIEVTFDGKTLERNITADDNGSWVLNTRVPSSAGGAHVISASGRLTSQSDVLPASFNVVAIMTVLPKNGNVNTEIRVTGSGFTSGKDFSVTWNDTPIASGTVNEMGVFQATFKAPAGKSGIINLTATDAKSITASSSFTMETTPPDVPKIASPADGATVGFMGSTRISFKWGAVSDPSGVTYDLEVSDQSNFDRILVSHTKMADFKYVLTEAEALTNGEYYWHVRAVDGAGNTSEWSQPSTVKVGFITLSTIIWIIVSVIALIILVAVLNRVLRKPKHHKSNDWE